MLPDSLSPRMALSLSVPIVSYPLDVVFITIYAVDPAYANDLLPGTPSFQLWLLVPIISLNARSYVFQKEPIPFLFLPIILFTKNSKEDLEFYRRPSLATFNCVLKWTEQILSVFIYLSELYSFLTSCFLNIKLSVPVLMNIKCFFLNSR